MSRTIKFRGKRFDNGEWVYGNLIIDDSGNCEIVDYENNHEIRYDIRGETIGQFTGLYDKNGKEIYEGDILMCIGQREDNKGRKYLRKVSFKNGSFCMGVPEYNIDSYLNNHIVNGKLNWEVIGNIYDNKELLEEMK